MTFSCYNSVRRVLGTTLLLVGLSLVLSPELLAEEAPEQESQSSEEPTAEPPDDVPNDPLPASGTSGVDAELDAMIEASKKEALENQVARTDHFKVESEEVEDSADTSILKTIGATSLGATGGLFGGYIAGFMVCDAGGFASQVDCFAPDHSVVFLGTVLGGIAGGYRGYKNGRVAIVVGGVLTGSLIGAIAASNSDIGLPVFVLSATSLGYLGNRLWRARESERNYAIIPTIAPNGSGLKFVGQF
jgi:hypothetical protein